MPFATTQWGYGRTGVNHDTYVSRGDLIERFRLHEETEKYTLEDKTADYLA